MNTYRSKSLITVILLSAPLYTNLSGCVTGSDTTPGSAQDAVAAKAIINRGIAKAQEIPNLLASFRNIEPAQLIIADPSVFPPTPVTEPQLSPHYGAYTEIAPAQFEFTPIAQTQLPTISIYYLNGIDLIFSLSSYDDNQILRSFSISLSANNRDIDTPPEQEVSGIITDTREDLPDTLSTFNDFTHNLASVSFAYIDATGKYAHYTYRRTVTHDANPFDIKHSITLSTNTTLAETTDITNTRVSTTTSKTYVETMLSGIWAASTLLRNYSDNEVEYETKLLLAKDGVRPIGENGSVAYYIDPKSAGVIYQENKKVATLKGGPSNCDLLTKLPSTTAPIVLAWSDLGIWGIMPGDSLGCQVAIITL